MIDKIIKFKYTQIKRNTNFDSILLYGNVVDRIKKENGITYLTKIFWVYGFNNYLQYSSSTKRLIFVNSWEVLDVYDNIEKAMQIDSKNITWPIKA